MSKRLISFFESSVRKFPKHIALEIGEIAYTYLQLNSLAKKIKGYLSQYKSDSPFVGLLTQRSITSYSGILGILKSGKAYMPISMKHPAKRSADMLNIAKVDIIIVGNECLSYLYELLPLLKRKQLKIIFPDLKRKQTTIYNDFTSVAFVFSDDYKKSEKNNTKSGNKFAYLLFTSGSTGSPKGVPITHSNACTYINHIHNKFRFSPTDRFSQFFDLSFDPSIHDLFVCWAVGACLCVLPEKQQFAPLQFIKEKKISIWYSVPSVIAILNQLKMLKPNLLPHLRYSFFSADVLTTDAVRIWRISAPNSIIVNLYGPTEVTINISLSEIDLKYNLKGHTIPIGPIFETHTYCILNDDLTEVIKGEEGMLYICGKQVFDGYLGDEKKSTTALIRFSGKKGIWYRTGDIVKEGEKGILSFVGRIDHQLKIRGYRIELEEINVCLRKKTKGATIITLAVGNLEKKYLASFICSAKKIGDFELIHYCKQHLPEYMIPKKFIWMNTIPLTKNGKIDVNKLLEEVK